jgi:predicted adenylyl cyclase CyaB
MKEVEILVELKSSFEKAKKILSKYDFKGVKKTLDIYFFDPKREDLKLSKEGKLWSSCRVRNKNNVSFLTYKKDHYDGETWLYSDEYEVTISNFDCGIKILKNLGLKELVRIDNSKYTYLVGDEYEIVLEDVVGLGKFLEVEYLKTVNDDEVEIVKTKILKFINGLGFKISNELNSGKPELMLNKYRNEQ